MSAKFPVLLVGAGTVCGIFRRCRQRRPPANGGGSSTGAKTPGGEPPRGFVYDSFASAGRRGGRQTTGRRYRVSLEIVRVDEFSDPAILQNPPDRCYRCKKLLFQGLLDFAEKNGLKAAADGTNFDDLSEYRPGLRALKELGIHSPLAEAGLTKSEVRRLAAEYGLRVSRKPSSPCMATRLPYGDTLTPEKLHQAAAGEELLKLRGFPVNRVRIHGNLARVEIPKGEFSRFLEQVEEITEELKKLGILYVTLDLQGFRSGSMDEALKI